MNSTENLLELKNVVVEYKNHADFLFKKYPPVRAVNGVSFALGTKEYMGVVGESGCGKSSLALAIMLLNKVKSGQMLFHGQDMLSDNKAKQKSLRKYIQMIFQDPYSSLNPKHRVKDIVQAPLRFLRGEKYCQDKVVDILHKVGIDASHINKYPHEFSGGQRQRIAIARALITSPSLLIADEPLSALDVSVQAQITQLLIELREKLNISCLFISHDLAVVSQLCSRVIVMYKGSIVEAGEVKQVIRQPKHPFTKKLVSAVPNRYPDKLWLSEDNNDSHETSDSISTRKGRLYGEGCLYAASCPLRQERCTRETPNLRGSYKHNYACWEV